MKATGIVRRIDDLGRVVVPKEIRRVLRIREGDPLEIYTGNTGEVILKKYSPINELSQFADEYAESASRVLGATIIVSDTDQDCRMRLRQKGVYGQKSGQRAGPHHPEQKPLLKRCEDRGPHYFPGRPDRFHYYLAEGTCRLGGH